MKNDRPSNTNRSWWDRYADDYQRDHGADLEQQPMAWGVWRIPETELNVLGDVGGKDVLEYGCGAAQWSIALERRRARVVGLDISESHLAHASRLVEESGSGVSLVLGDGEDTPFADESFDIVFCDHGAMTFSRPERTIAEAARLLRPGGTLAFCVGAPLRDVCDNGESVGPELQKSYFDGLGRLSYREASGEEMVWFQLPYGEWIRLFRRHGLVVEDLIELRPPVGAQTSYSDFVTLDWARRWPAESLWRLTREPAAAP